jgi:hypothetical protein
MKQTSYIGFILLAGFAISGCTSCTKEVSGEFTQYQNNPLNDTVWATTLKATDAVNSIVNDLMPAVEKETFNLENTRSEIKVGRNDSFRIYFDKGIFTSLENGVITPVKPEGTAEIQIFRIRRTGDLIKCLRSTQSGNVLMETAGGFFIRVVKDGKELNIASDKKYTVYWIETGANPKLNMLRYYGKESSPAPGYNVTDPNFEWKPDADSKPIPYLYEIGSTSPRGYDITLSSLRWVSMQKNVVPNSSNPSPRLTTIFSPNFTNKNTTVFAYYKRQKTVVELDFDYASRSFKTDLLPAGADIKIVSISKIGSVYYLGKQELSSLVVGSPIKIVPEKIALDKLQAYLDEQ